jgi:hypothetical protein
MSRNLESSIKTYINHFKTRLKRLDEYDLHVEDRLLKKNIVVSILDAISRVTSNPSDGNRERFTAIVAHFGQWPDHSRVSVPHVSYLLRHLRAPAFEGARQFIAKSVKENLHGGFVPLSSDPELDSVKKLWPVPAEQKLIGQLSLSSFTHLNLLYQHRNSLVHELREPGYGMEFDATQDEPFYHGMTSVGDEGSPAEQGLELVYPLRFFFCLADRVVSNVEIYLRKNSINPYSAYKFGSSWISELNT